MGHFDQLMNWLEAASERLSEFLFGEGSKPPRHLIIYDKERGGVLYCPQVPYDEVIPLDYCKACAHYEKPSLANGFSRMCLFDDKKRKVEESQPFSPRSGYQPRIAFGESAFRSERSGSSRSRLSPFTRRGDSEIDSIERRLDTIIEATYGIEKQVEEIEEMFSKIQVEAILLKKQVEKIRETRQDRQDRYG